MSDIDALSDITDWSEVDFEVAPRADKRLQVGGGWLWTLLWLALLGLLIWFLVWFIRAIQTRVRVAKKLIHHWKEGKRPYEYRDDGTWWMHGQDGSIQYFDRTTGRIHVLNATESVQALQSGQAAAQIDFCIPPPLWVDSHYDNRALTADYRITTSGLPFADANECPGREYLYRKTERELRGQ